MLLAPSFPSLRLSGLPAALDRPPAASPYAHRHACGGAAGRPHPARFVRVRPRRVCAARRPPRRLAESVWRRRAAAGGLLPWAPTRLRGRRPAWHARPCAAQRSLRHRREHRSPTDLLSLSFPARTPTRGTDWAPTPEIAPPPTFVLKLSRA